MKFDLQIAEYPDFTYIVPGKNGAFFLQAERLMYATEKKVEQLAVFNDNPFIMKSATGGIWVSTDHCGYFYDLGAMRLQDEVEYNYDYSIAWFSENHVVGQAMWRDGKLVTDHYYSRHLVSGEAHTLPKRMGAGLVDLIAVDPASGNIFTGHRERIDGHQERIYTCYDAQFNVLWSYRHDSDERGFIPRGYLVNGHFIINGIINKQEHNNFELIALSAENGRPVWQAAFDGPMNHSILVNDKIYLHNNGRLVIVDAAGGEKLGELSLGFSSKIPEEYHLSFENQLGLIEHRGYLFAFGLYSGAIHVFSPELELIQEIALPAPHTAHCLNRFRGAPSEFATDGDTIYATLYYSTGMSALAMISPVTPGEEPKVTVAPRCEFQLETVPQQVGHAYRISTDSSDLDEVISAGQYKICEIGQYYGVDPSFHEHYDPELNEYIIFSVKRDRLPGTADEELLRMAKRAEKHLDHARSRSKKTNKRFKVEIEFR